MEDETVGTSSSESTESNVLSLDPPKEETSSELLAQLFGDSAAIPPPPTSARESIFNKADSNFVFGSPLSVLETIRAVSNIIVGSSKSFDSVFNTIVPETTKIFNTQQDSELTAIPDYNTKLE